MQSLTRSLGKLVDLLFGFDFFVSYSHADGRQYPRHLARRLEKIGFKVFLDSDVYVAGDDLKISTRRRVRMSKKLIVVAGPAALSSKWVLREVEECLAAKRTPIVVDLNRAFVDASTNQLLKLKLEDRLYIDEKEIDDEQHPSQATIDSLVRSFDAARQETVRRRAISATALLLGALFVFAVWQWGEAVRQRDATERQLLATYWGNGILARDRDNEALKAAHFFARIASQTKNKRESSSAQEATLNLTRDVKLVQVLVHPDAGGALFSEDANRILTWSNKNSGGAALWDVRTGTLLFSLKDKARFRDARWIRDETRVLTTSGDFRGNFGALRVWDSETGCEVTQPMIHNGPVLGHVLTRDGGRILSWGADGTARIWDAETGKPLTKPLEDESRISGASYNSDETQVLTWSGADSSFARDDTQAGSVRLWDVANGQILSELPHEQGVREAYLSWDGRRVLSRDNDGVARLWEVRNAEAIVLPVGSVQGVAFDRTGDRILTWSGDRTVRVLDGQTGNAISPPLEHARMVRGARFLENNKHLISWGEDGTVRVWNLQEASETASDIFVHRGFVVGAELSPFRSRIVAWSSGGIASLWDAQSGQRVSGPLEHGEQINGALFSADEEVLSTWTDEGSVMLWNGRTGEPLTVPLRHDAAIRGVTFSRSGILLASWGEDDTVRVWARTDARNDIEVSDGIGGLALGESETRIAVWVAGKYARVWDRRTNRPTTPEMTHPSIDRAAFALDDTRLVTWNTTGAPAAVRIWDTETGSALKTFAPCGWCAEPIISEDGRGLLIFDKQAAQVWSTANGEALSPPISLGDEIEGGIFGKEHSSVLAWSRHAVAFWESGSAARQIAEFEHVDSVSLSPEGTRILVLSRSNADDGSTGELSLWDKTGQPVQIGMLQAGGVRAATFSSDGKRIVSWSGSWTAALWDGETGVAVASLEGTPDVESAVFDESGDRVLTWGGSVRVWSSQDGQPLTPAFHTHADAMASFSSDGERVLTQGRAALQVWSAVNGEPISPPIDPGPRLLKASLSKDGSRIFTQSTESGLSVWDSESGRLLSRPISLRGRISGALTINNDQSALMWSSNVVTSRVIRSLLDLPAKALPLHVEVSTGTKMSNVDELEVLSAPKWQSVSSEYAKLSSHDERIADWLPPASKPDISDTRIRIFRDARTDTESSNQLEKYLRAQGYRVLLNEPTEYDANEFMTVRYFDDADQAAAQSLAKLLDTYYTELGLNQSFMVTKPFQRHAHEATGYLEVNFDFRSDIDRPAKDIEQLLAASNAAHGEELVEICLNCHGLSTIDTVREWPTLHGQNAPYLLMQMREFRAAVRNNPLCEPQLVLYLDYDFASMAVFLSQQERRRMPTSIDSRDKIGEHLYENGLDPSSRPVLCASCHGVAGEGRSEAAIPALAGQNGRYLAIQMHAFRDGLRKDTPSVAHRSIGNMTDEHIESLGNYLQYLGPSRELQPSAE